MRVPIFGPSNLLQLAGELVARGIREDQIGVITPYRQQIKILAAMLQEMKAIEVLTADKSQGRDKDCIIISMVRSNDLGSVSPSEARNAHH